MLTKEERGRNGLKNGSFAGGKFKAESFTQHTSLLLCFFLLRVFDFHLLLISLTLGSGGTTDGTDSIGDD